jgi:drug/metabolite transporter superfamily protein YnfA
MIRALPILVAAALLECGGVALVRLGVERRLPLLVLGAASLLAYGVIVNRGGVNFGQLMGSYIATFFLVSQVIALITFREVPALRTLLGGALIIAGGMTILG